MSSPGTFKRWYDLDVSLSDTVRNMEALSQASQTLFGLLMNRFSDRIVQTRGHAFYTQLNWKKLSGIAKGSRARRWYDQESLMHKAFSKLYSLSDADRGLIARQLRLPVEQVLDYEKKCLRKSIAPDIETVCRIVEACFQTTGDGTPGLNTG